MRPTRWTRLDRVTHYGRGGWLVRWSGPMYVHPVTGDAVYAGWRLRRLLAVRSLQEARRREMA
jgi:hypothetical protein